MLSRKNLTAWCSTLRSQPKRKTSSICSPLVIAPKATAPLIRFCGDYHKISEFISIPKHPIPVVAHELTKASQFKVFVNLDTTNSLHSIPRWIVDWLSRPDANVGIKPILVHLSDPNLVHPPDPNLADFKFGKLTPTLHPVAWPYLTRPRLVPSTRPYKKSTEGVAVIMVPQQPCTAKHRTRFQHLN